MIAEVASFCRVSILGNSVPLFVSPARNERGNSTYGEWLERVLNGRGLPTVVTNESRYNGVLSDAICRFDETLRAPLPDVVVLHYGMAEALPAAVPLRVHEWLHTHHQHAGWGRPSVRKAMLGHVWPPLRAYQKLAAERLGGRTFHMSPDRFKAELQHLLYFIRRDVGALVFVMGTYPPGPSQRHWVPGIDKRVDLYDEVMREVTQGFADDVRFVHWSRLAERVPIEAAVGDGFHLSPEGHRAVADILAEEVLSWAATQPHLPHAPTSS